MQLHRCYVRFAHEEEHGEGLDVFMDGEPFDGDPHKIAGELFGYLEHGLLITVFSCDQPERELLTLRPASAYQGRIGQTGKLL